MKKFLKAISEKYSDAKSRTVLVFVGALLVIGVVLAVTNMGAEKTLDSVVTSASVAKLGSGGVSNPGVGNASEEYNKLRYEKNNQEASKAEKDGRSSVPTIVSDQVIEENTKVDLIRRQQEQLARERQDAYKKLLADRERAERDAASNQRNSVVSAEQRARQQGYENLMSGQAQSLLAAWGVAPRQAYTAGTQPAADLTQAVGPGGAAPGASGSLLRPPNIIQKAGDIVFAVLDTSINSDEQGPVLARIVSGKLKGAKIIGNYQKAGLYAKKLKLVFNVLSLPNMPNSVTFNAVAIDPEVGRTALASNVDNHYLMRYGSMFGSSFLEGMSEAVIAALQNTGITTTTSGNVEGNTVRSTERDQIITGLGSIGKQIAQNTNIFDRPATITIDAGTGFGLLMLSDLNLNSEPATADTLSQSARTLQQETVDVEEAARRQRRDARSSTGNNLAGRESDVFSSAIRDAIQTGGFYRGSVTGTAR